ncbi:MAG: 4Fe-4S binding protein [Planctomycetaceae bacterium]
MAKTGARKKLPKEVAIINADNCTGCDACLEICPVDCIDKVPGSETLPLQSWCEIDVERCVGCEVCVHIPTKRSNPYELLVCPWDAIEMVKTVDLAHAVAAKGGPPEYLRENWERVVEPAIQMAELAAAGS